MSHAVSVPRTLSDGLRAVRAGILPWAALCLVASLALPLALGCGLFPVLLVTPALALAGGQLVIGLVDGEGTARIGLPEAYQVTPQRGLRTLGILSLVLSLCAALSGIPIAIGATLGALYADHPTVVLASWVSFGAVALGLVAVIAPRATLLAIQAADEEDASPQRALSAGTALWLPVLTIIHALCLLLGAALCGVGLIPASLFCAATLASAWRQQHPR